MDKLQRKRWSQEPHSIIMTPKRHERIPVAKQLEPSPKYDEYLLLLQQKNKMLEKVKLTDKAQLEKEKKEKGFTLYVNGANDNKKGKRRTPNPSPRITSNARLAAELTHMSLKPSADSGLPTSFAGSRSRSAPDKSQKTPRKNWNTSSVNIQTARGDKMHLHAPETITGNYEEDFEDETIAENLNTNNNEQETLTRSNGKGTEQSDLTQSISDHVLLSISDVSKLRKSLELSKFVRESICQDTDDDDDSDLEEEIINTSNPETFSPADTIILEFAPAKSFSHQTTPRRSSSSQSNSHHRIKRRSNNSNGHKRNVTDIELKTSDSIAKTPRPLSSVKRTSRDGHLESKEERNRVLSALEDENRDFSQQQAKQLGLCSKELVQPGNPLINSFMLSNEDDMREVENRVLQMEPRQQRDLIKTLYQLERTVRPSSTAALNKEGKHDRTKSKDSQVHKVMLEFVSNWGAKNLIGLTEILLLNESNQKIDVNTSFLKLDGAKNCCGVVSNLFNSRYRTVKDRNMFCCEKSGERPISLSFRVEIPLGTQINKIKFWNYNKSLEKLNIGVRRLRISIDDDIIYDGDIEKGCGNQVFDYGQTIVLGTDDPDSDNGFNGLATATMSTSSQQLKQMSFPDHSPNCSTSRDFSKQLHHPNHKTVHKSTEHRQSSEMWIPLSETPEPIERAQTRVLMRSTDGVEPPVVYSSDSDDERKTYNQNDVTHANKFESTIPDTVVSGKLSDPRLTDTRVNETNPHKNGARSKLPWMETSADCSTLQDSKSLNTSTGRPAREKKHPEWLDKSEEGSLRSSLDEMLEALDKWEPLDRRKPEDLKTIFDGTVKEAQPSTGIPTMVASETEEANYRKTASKEMTRAQRRRANNCSAAESRRKKWQQPSVDLEASWTSLDMFARSHKGRLSMEGDALDEYLRSVSTPGTGITVDATGLLSKEQPSTTPLQVISEEEAFIIPELPSGENLVINIKSTWGDKYYVGLTGIELFASNGEPISIAKVAANPRDINVLPDYKNDPRVVENLVDGVNKTRDDTHMWLAPFTEGANHFISLQFTQASQLALFRIWNYNKSRIHSYRGAKDVEIQLDGRYIFKGEIARACGGTQGGTEAFGDTILFTVSDEILDAVSRHDGQYEGGNFSDDWEDDVPYEARPATAEKGNSDRPHTSVDTKMCKKGMSVHHSINTPPQATAAASIRPESMATPVAVDGTTLVYRATEISLNFTETWGDPHYLGLTSMDLVAKDGEAIPLSMEMLSAKPQDLHVLPGYETDDRTLDKLVDGVSITTSDEHMWLIPYSEGADHTLTITLRQSQELVGLRFWNYNKSPEDTYRGAKTVHVQLDGLAVSPPQGFLVRKGPGNCFFDFAQELLFSEVLRRIQLDSQLCMPDSNSWGDELEDYVISAKMPKGFVYQFHLMSSQSDLYYLGLNAIEFYDSEGKKIPLDANNVAAYPESVNVLDGIEGDIRTPDKLVGDATGSNSDHNMWLSPILPGITNRLFVIFDYPQTVSMIKIWNYSKSPKRGVREFALLVDDLLVYNGVFGPVTFGRGILPNTTGPQNFHTILFTNDEKIKNKVKHTVVSNETEELDVQLTNDNLVMSKPLKLPEKPADQALRPKTGIHKQRSGKRW
ncbi:katanin-interacting protein-like [Watersipora subatra]|uniref:katanin-interacting protein-like n=1 Tax=Watersipora subatra TaxID=2589382 RepID=UPI00355C3455